MLDGKGKSPSGDRVEVLLVEDHVSFRQSLAFLLEREYEVSNVVEAGSVAEAREVLDGGGVVDVAVIDLGLPDGDGTELVRDFSGRGIAVLVLTASVNHTDSARSVEAGASGVLQKTAAVNEIVDCVQRLRAGEVLLPPQKIIELLRVASRDRQQNHEARRSLDRLTPRERDVLEALAEGLDSEQIARKLHISIESERTHVVNILTKLGVHSRVQALVLAARHGAIEFR